MQLQISPLLPPSEPKNIPITLASRDHNAELPLKSPVLFLIKGSITVAPSPMKNLIFRPYPTPNEKEKQNKQKTKQKEKKGNTNKENKKQNKTKSNKITKTNKQTNKYTKTPLGIICGTRTCDSGL